MIVVICKVSESIAILWQHNDNMLMCTLFALIQFFHCWRSERCLQKGVQHWTHSNSIHCQSTYVDIKNTHESVVSAYDFDFSFAWTEILLCVSLWIWFCSLYQTKCQDSLICLHHEFQISGSSLYQTKWQDPVICFAIDLKS